jgi:hypothetical protein
MAIKQGCHHGAHVILYLNAYQLLAGQKRNPFLFCEMGTGETEVGMMDTVQAGAISSDKCQTKA